MKFVKTIIMTAMCTFPIMLFCADAPDQDPIAAAVNKMDLNEWPYPHPYINIFARQSNGNKIADVVFKYIPPAGKKCVISCYIDNTKNTYEQALPFVNSYDVLIVNRVGKELRLSYSISKYNKSTHLYDISLPSKSNESGYEGGGRQPIAFRINMYDVSSKLDLLFPLTLDFQFSANLQHGNTESDTIIKISGVKIEKKGDQMYISASGRP